MLGVRTICRLLAAAAFLAAFASLPSTADTPGNTLVIAQDIEGIISLDPAEAFEELSLQMTGVLYDRLFAYDPKSETRLRPQIAESWSASADGKVYTFKLKPGLTFASGNPLTSEDVLYSIRRALLLKKGPTILLAQIGLNAENADKALSAPAPDTFVLTLPDRFATGIVLGVMSSLPSSVVDKKVVEQHAKDGDFGYAWLKMNSAGSGPFKLISWQPSETLVLESVASYHEGAPPTKRIVYRHVKEAGTQQLLLERGDIDMAMNLGPEQIQALQGKKNLKTETFPRGQLLYLAVNEKVKELANPKVKEALRYLIDYKGISEQVLRGQYAVHQSFWPAGAPWALETTPYSLDVEKAKKLLAEAGLSGGLSFKLDVINQYPYIEIGQALQASMAKAGIRIELQMSDQKALLGKYRARNHEAVVSYWGPDYFDIHANAGALAWNPDPSDASTFKTPPWRNNWVIPEINAETEKLAVEVDQDKRKAGYMALQAKYQTTAPIIIMLQRSDLVVMKQSVNGLVIGPLMFQTVLNKVTK